MRCSLMCSFVLGFLVACGDLGQVDSSMQVDPDAGIRADARPTVVPTGGVTFADVTIGIREAPCCATDAELSSMTAYSVANLSAPTVGNPVVDPTFNVTIHSTPTGMRHTYSQLQAFSSDSRYLMLDDAYGNGAGGTRVYSFPAMIEVAALPAEFNFHRWIPGTTRILGLEGSPVRVSEFDVETGVTTLLHTFSDDIGSGPQGWEEVGGSWIGIFMTAPTERVVFYNLDEDRVGWSFNVAAHCAGGGAVDWIAPDRSGRYALIAAGDGTGTCRGVRSYDIETGAFVAQVHTHHAHSDKGLLSDGTPFMMSLELAHPNDSNWPGLFTYQLGADVDTPARMIPWGRFDHIACMGNPGLGCVISAGDEFDLDGFRSELFVQQAEAPFDAIRLVHHRNTCDGDYSCQTQPSVSADGRWVIFASTWGGANGNTRSYIIQLDE